MKKWGIILILVCAAGFAGWRWVSPVPRIEFQRFEEGRDGREAVFKIVNEGTQPACFLGYAVTNPFVQLRTWTANGWKEHLGAGCGNGARMQKIAPGGSVEFSVKVPRDRQGERFQVGMHLRSGTPPTSGSASLFEQWTWEIRHLIGLGDPDPTWSDTVRS